MTHHLEAIIREAYGAFGRGDVDGYLRPCPDDFAFHVRGVGEISGIYIGKDAMYALTAKAMTITGGTLNEEVEDVLANDNYAVVLARHRFTRAPATFDDAWGTGSK